MQKDTWTKQEVIELLEKRTPVLILDVRDEAKFQAGTLTSEFAATKNVPYVHMLEQDKPLDEETDSVAKNAQIITVCTSGNKAQKAAALLRQHGYEAKALLGGLTAWNEPENEDE
ncbi:rhodanese-like domain-containing protein [Brevibacillus gelatini]|uniref:Rhodanese-like domain-containing protein n=1 Tax=Brevibacillus gelatini TaxID=1655277 RepID=A0A3M8B6H5_9BACL|nr:rhodanese-like domain-containing protein [Brevibacillus gelatini]RNB58960.1 rhodanese-like domain-containing protein [Brevibacillus gelatini]